MRPVPRLGTVLMRILFLALNYPPETKPSQDLIYNLAGLTPAGIPRMS